MCALMCVYVSIKLKILNAYSLVAHVDIVGGLNETTVIIHKSRILSKVSIEIFKCEFKYK